MSDIIFTSRHSLPQDCVQIGQNASHILGISRQPQSYPITYEASNGIVTALLTRTLSVPELFKSIRIWRQNFVGHIGVSAGIIWNTKTDEFCIFRDPFGFIPWMICRPQMPKDELDFSATTSPFVQNTWTQSRAIRHAWLANFLLIRDSYGLEDVFEGSERIMPGEFICACSTDFEHFINNLNTASAASCTPCRLVRRCLWNHKKYQTLSDSRQEIAAELRARISNAVDKIPDSNPCFTLSGGLDSTGILSSWCRSHSGSYDAISLVSPKHPRCDESHELDVLEKAFPIRLNRVCMDSAWLFSMPKIYSDFRAYGPFVAPGIESVLVGYRAVEEKLGPRTIVTGYGGNFLVKVRPDALINSLITRRSYKQLASEFASMTRKDVYYLFARMLANTADGQTHLILRSLFRRRSHSPRHTLLNPQFRARFPAVEHDPFYQLSHLKERAMIPVSWQWELRTRCLDIVARMTPHAFYDPLFDMELYDFCACIPPEYFLSCGKYREIYKEALSPLLPEEIIHHPKCQCYDNIIEDGLYIYERSFIEAQFNSRRMSEFIDIPKLTQLYDEHCTYYQSGRQTDGCNLLWPAISTLVWSASDGFTNAAKN